MGIAGQNAAAFAAAQSQYEAIFQDFWNNRNDAFIADQASRDVQTGAKTTVIPILTGFPRLREWLGEKHFKDLRAQAVSIEMRKYEKSIRLDRLDVELDPQNIVDPAINGFLSTNKNDIEDVLVTKLLANTWTGYDGVTLLNDAHPFSNSTGDNLTTAAFSATTWRAAVRAMALFADEQGNPLRVRPNLVVVGPAQEGIAKDVLASERIVPVSNAGVPDASANVVAAVVFPNYYPGADAGLIVSPWITGNQWFAMDTTKVGLRPILRVLHKELHPEMLGPGMKTDHEFLADEYLYSVQGDFAHAPGLWQLIYGSVTA